MPRQLKLAVLFLAIALCAFGVAYYLYSSYIDFLAVSDYYAIPREAYSTHPDVAATLLNFQFGIATSAVGGFASLVGSVYLSAKHFLKDEQENDQRHRHRRKTRFHTR